MNKEETMGESGFILMKVWRITIGLHTSIIFRVYIHSDCGGEVEAVDVWLPFVHIYYYRPQEE